MVGTINKHVDGWQLSFDFFFLVGGSHVLLLI